MEVVNSANHRALAGSRVFVLDENGQEIATTETDRDGVARLEPPAAGARPKYVLVEHPAFFISGVRWQSGLFEYYLLVTRLTVK